MELEFVSLASTLDVARRLTRRNRIFHGTESIPSVGCFPPGSAVCRCHSTLVIDRVCSRVRVRAESFHFDKTAPKNSCKGGFRYTYVREKQLPFLERDGPRYSAEERFIIRCQSDISAANAASTAESRKLVSQHHGQVPFHGLIPYNPWTWHPSVHVDVVWMDCGAVEHGPMYCMCILPCWSVSRTVYSPSFSSVSWPTAVFFLFWCVKSCIPRSYYKLKRSWTQQMRLYPEVL